MPTASINGHQMYYEVHGEGPPAVYIGGWDTFCHGRHHYLARGMTDSYQTVIIDYRGIGESTDDLSMTPSTELFADDIAALLDHLNMKSVYFVGLVGMGACIGQWVASYSFRPDYYNAYRDKLLGSEGVWGNLEGRIPAHLRFIQACLGHDIRPHLGEIAAPTLVVHAGQDVITGPRTTLPLEQGLPNGVGVTMDQVAHVVAGKEEKIAFCKILFDFLGKY